MEGFDGPWMTTLALFGVAAGLFLLARGVQSHRTVIRVADTSTSTIASIAAGEVRVSGIIEPAEMTLVSLLQSRPCVYYKATIGSDGDGRTSEPDYTEERSIGFRVRDGSGSLRVFPRGAWFDAPVRFEDETSLTGDRPSGLDLRRTGSTMPAEIDREVAAAALLAVQEPWASSSGPGRDRRGKQSYRELRLEPGDHVTIVGRALPFSDLTDPSGADVGADLSGIRHDDPEVAADLAEARARGQLADDAAAAWGNAAIPGFGIGRPVRTAVIDPAADPLQPAGPDEAAKVERTFTIAPDALVLAASDEVPLLIAHGMPGAVVQRGQTRFIVGLLGAVLAITSAMALAVNLGGSGR